MGLAASQARFLAITARKMNCEFQSMQIAQEKLSVTRDLQKAAQDYQNSLGATKLIWDADNKCDGTGEIYDLSYGLMMTPSALTEYDPYLITDTQGKIVLSETMFQAAVDAGIIDTKTGDPIASNNLFKRTGEGNDKLGSRDAFLDKLTGSNIIDANVATSIKNLGKDGYTKSGIGGDIINKKIAAAMTINDFTKYLTETEWTSETIPNDKTDVKIGDLVYNIGFADLFAKTDNNGEKEKDADGNYVYNICETSSPNLNTDSGKILITQNGKALSISEMNKLTLGDILSGKYEMSGIGIDAISFGTKPDYAKKVLNAFGEKLSYALGVSDEQTDALSSALDFTMQQLLQSNFTTSSGSTTYSQLSNAIKSSQSTNGIVKGANNMSSVSLTNMLKSLLTNYAIALDGYDSGYAIDAKSTKKSIYVTDDLNYYYMTKDTSSIADNSALLNADFYNQLYNQLCSVGACTDKTKRAQITDSEYLNNALKNGQLFVSCLSTDGYFYQGHYTATEHIAEIEDDDAIAAAEAEYNVKKSKLNYKEQNLELKMKNIDTELSALSTEYDTVKNLISKNVEKVFTMFSSS